MREITRERKNANKFFASLSGGGWLRDQMVNVIVQGKRAFDEAAMQMGKMLAETFLCMEREELSGPDYYPLDPTLKKWASQPGTFGGRRPHR